VKRAFAAWAALIYVGVLLAGMTGAAVVLIVGAVVFLLAFPQYVQADPYDSTSELDHRDGIGIGAR
jgi:fatty acid desaturase